MPTTETVPADTASCTCDSPGGPVSHHDYCELNHPNHPCHEECCKFVITATVPTLSELIAQQLCSMHVIDGHFVRLDSTVDDNGAIALDVTGIDFTAPDSTISVWVHLSDPIPTNAAASGVEIGASA